MPLGEKLKEARKKCGLSQQELAEAISTGNNSFGNTSISNWENNINKPDPDTIIKLCNILKVDANYLMDYNNETYTTTVYKDDISSIEIKSDKPLSSLSEEEQQMIIQRAMDELYEFKRDLKKKEK